MTSRKKGPRRKLFPNRGAKLLSHANVTKNGVFGNSGRARKLIRCQDDVLLYELSHGRGYEVVSPNGECWNFPLRCQAESKFERLRARREGNGKRLG